MTNIAIRATGIATPTATAVVLPSFLVGSTIAVPVLVGVLGRAIPDEDVDVEDVDVEDEELVDEVLEDDEVDVADVEGIKSNGICATTVAAGAIRKIFVAVLQHSNDPIPFPPGSQQLIAN